MIPIPFALRLLQCASRTDSNGFGASDDPAGRDLDGAYSDSASGTYIRNTLFKKLGIESQMQGRARIIAARPIGAIVARAKRTSASRRWRCIPTRCAPIST
jgi:hypothetical protein